MLINDTSRTRPDCDEFDEGDKVRGTRPVSAVRGLGYCWRKINLIFISSYKIGVESSRVTFLKSSIEDRNDEELPAARQHREWASECAR